MSGRGETARGKKTRCAQKDGKCHVKSGENRVFGHGRRALQTDLQSNTDLISKLLGYALRAYGSFLSENNIKRRRRHA